MKNAYLIFALVCITITHGLAQGLAVNADGANAHPSSILDAQATDKGMLVPRMTAAQRTAITSPATSLLVYQTDAPAGFYFYNGTTWIALTTTASGWAVTGNAAGTTDFIGTTTNQPLRLRASNLEHARLTQRGTLELGLGTFNNLFIGQNAGAVTDLNNQAVRDFPNIFIGPGAGQSNTTGDGNLFTGFQAGLNNTAGDANVFIGFQAGRASTISFRNVFTGTFTGLNNTTGSDNVFMGFRAGQSNTTGSSNVFTGSNAGFNNTTGENNVFTGFQAGFNNTTGWANVFTGNTAGRSNTTGSNNVFTGIQAGFNNTTGFANVFSGNTTGFSNTTGAQNVFTGTGAGFNNIGGNNNVFTGNNAGQANTSGSFNTFVGLEAGFSNTTGNSNVFLGYQAGRNEIISNQLIIANNATIPLIRGNFATGQLFNQLNSASWNTTSDRRIKQNVQALEGGLATLARLRPVRYEFTPEWVRTHPALGGRRYYGVIAQEYREVFPDDVKPTSDTLPGEAEPVLSVDMASAQIVAIKAIQELAAEVEKLKQENAALKAERAEARATKAEVEELKARQAQTEARFNELYKLLQTNTTNK